MDHLHTRVLDECVQVSAWLALKTWSKSLIAAKKKIAICWIFISTGNFLFALILLESSSTSCWL